MIRWNSYGALAANKQSLINTKLAAEKHITSRHISPAYSDTNMKGLVCIIPGERRTKIKNVLEFSVDAAVLIRDYHFYSAEAFFGIDSVSLVHITHQSAEHLHKGEAAVLHLSQLRRCRRATILSVKHQNIWVDLF